MATAETFVANVMDQLAGVGGITSRKMFGEYALFKEGKVVALICDGQLFVKPTVAGRNFIGQPLEAPPYKGAKPSFLIEAAALDNPGLAKSIGFDDCRRIACDQAQKTSRNKKN